MLLPPMRSILTSHPRTLSRNTVQLEYRIEIDVRIGDDEQAVVEISHSIPIA